jgi:GTP cyclohydrolase I
MEIKEISWQEIDDKIEKIKKEWKGAKIWGVPKNGLILSLRTGFNEDDIEKADVILDDIIDSGNTKQRIVSIFPSKPFVALYEKKEENVWYKFPWETQENDIEQKIVRILEFIGEDAKREGLIETPKRIVKSWDKLYGGYKQSPKGILSKVFTQKYDEIVLLKNIELYSTCEHHLLPFYGKAHIAYIPNGKVVGISKLARLLECFSRRLQIQERLCNEVVDALEENLKPKGGACIIEAQHFCMTSRGIEKQNSVMTTSALRGAFREKQEAREELLNLIRGD